jgi:hypothetical protein
MLVKYFGTILATLSPKDSFNRLTPIKELPILLNQIQNQPLKLPFIAQMINSFMNEDTPDSEKIRIFLHLKSICQNSILSANNNPSNNSSTPCGTGNNVGQNQETGNPFVNLLCAIHFDELQNKQGKPSLETGKQFNGKPKSSQYITLLWSECLTVINT